MAALAASYRINGFKAPSFKTALLRSTFILDVLVQEYCERVERMLVVEFKTYGKSNQFKAVDEAMRTAQFIRNSYIHLWMDNKGTGKNDLQKYCAILAKNFPFANELNSMARQASAERAWSSISRFFDNCKKGIPGQKGFPKFQKNCRSVEYKTSGWTLAENRKSITFTDKKNIGYLKLKGTRDLHFYSD